MAVAGAVWGAALPNEDFIAVGELLKCCGGDGVPNVCSSLLLRGGGRNPMVRVMYCARAVVGADGGFPVNG